MTDFMLDDGTYVNIGDEFLLKGVGDVGLRIKVIELNSFTEMVKIMGHTNIIRRIEWYRFKAYYLNRYNPINIDRRLPPHKFI